jgi:thiol:disulfide interchange protein
MQIGMRLLAVLAFVAIGAFLARGRFSNGAPSLDEELRKARTVEAPLVVEFSMTGCAACRQFENTILTRPVVQEAMKQVYFVRYNVTEDAAGQDAAARLDVRAYPTVVVVGDSGKERVRMEGFPAGEPGAAYFAEFLGKAARWAPLLRKGGAAP